MNILEKYGLGDYASVYHGAIEVDNHEKLEDEFMDGELLLKELEKRIGRASFKTGIELAIRTVIAAVGPQKYYAGTVEYTILRDLRMLLEKG